VRAALIAIALAACQSSDVSRDVGARCTEDSECNVKCLEPGADWPGGFCTVLCDSDADCPSGDRCLDEDDGVCAVSCGSDGECTFLGAYTCESEDSKGGGTKVMVCRGD